MIRFILGFVSGLLIAGPLFGADAKYSIKTATTEVPKELKEIGKLLSDQSVQLLDDKGDLLAEYWFRKELPAKATPAQIKNGLSYRELEETTVLGAVKLAKPMTDFRKQKVNAGLYTFRLGFQPMDGDHMGTAPHPEFALLVPANLDEHPEPLKNAKELQELSARAVAGSSSHPCVFLLVPNTKPEDMAKLINKGGGLWVIGLKAPVVVGGQKTSLGVGLTVIGQAE